MKLAILALRCKPFEFCIAPYKVKIEAISVAHGLFPDWVEKNSTVRTLLNQSAFGGATFPKTRKPPSQNAPRGNMRILVKFDSKM